MPITHTDGKTYYSDDEMQTAIKDRLRSKDERITALEAATRDADTRLKAMEPELAKVATLTGERDSWQKKASEHEGAFRRYQSAASVGVTDQETIWALEQAHTRAMAAVEEGRRVDFGGYLNTAKVDPSVLPAYLRSVFASAGTSGAQAAAQGQAQGQQQTGAQAAQGANQGAAQGSAGGQGGAQQVAAQQSAQGAQGTSAGQQQRPSWAPAVTGQQPAPTGQRQDFASRVASAQTLEDVVRLQTERRQRPAG